MSNYNNDSRYQMFDVDFGDTESQLMLINRLEYGQPSTRDTTNLLESKIVVDTEADKKFLITAEYKINPILGAASLSKADKEKKITKDATIDSYHYVYEITDKSAILLGEQQVFDALGIEADDLKGALDVPLSSDGINRNGLDDVQEKISDKNIYRMMNTESKRLAQEAGLYSNKAPDNRTRLKGHYLLTEKVAEYKDAQLEAIKAIDRNWDDALRGTLSENDNIGVGLAHYDNTVESHREKLMQASLEKSGFLVIDDKLMDFKAAERFTNKKFSNVEQGQFMELGDIESALLIGLPSRETMARIKTELGDDPLDDQFIKGIVVRDKGSNLNTNIYLVEDIDKNVWMRADQTNTKGAVVSRNAESLSDIGIDPIKFSQGYKPPVNGRNVDILQMMARLNANNIRRVISESQIKEHDKLSLNDKNAAVARAAENDLKKIGNKTYTIQKLSDDQMREFKDWAAKSHSPIPEDALMNSAWQIENISDEDMIIIGNMTNKDLNAPFGPKHENRIVFINKSGYRTFGHNEMVDFKLPDGSILTASDIQKSLESLEDEYTNDDSLKDEFGLTEDERKELAKERDLEDETQSINEQLGMRMQLKR